MNDKPFEKGYLGKFNDQMREYDLLFDDKSRIVAKFPNGEIKDFAGHRIQVDIRLTTYNYMKESELSGDEIREGGECVIRLNNFQVYSFFFRDPAEALLTAREKLNALFWHSIQTWRPEEREALKGRKVFYRDYPCFVDHAIWDQGCVILKTEKGEPFPTPSWDDDRDRENTIKDDILSPHIWWYRKKPPPAK